jgi:molecular chaperone HscB
MIDFSSNHFELFGLPARFGIDASALDAAYRALQSEVHPDRFAAGTDAERRVAMQSATRVNESYRALKDPVSRASHLLELNGIVGVGDDADTALDFDFLERQLDRREMASEAQFSRDERALESLHEEVRLDITERQEALRRMLDDDRAFDDASNAVKELRFLAKLAADLRKMIADVEA